jgi:hypothetical protein
LDGQSGCELIKFEVKAERDRSAATLYASSSRNGVVHGSGDLQYAQTMAFTTLIDANDSAMLPAYPVAEF